MGNSGSAAQALEKACLNAPVNLEEIRMEEGVNYSLNPRIIDARQPPITNKRFTFYGIKDRAHALEIAKWFCPMGYQVLYEFHSASGIVYVRPFKTYASAAYDNCISVGE